MHHVANELHLSPERVRQLQIHALKTLRSPDHDPSLLPWAG
ncbi:MAG: hypothetical protein ACJ72N_20615 [Labedaea sp.]